MGDALSEALTSLIEQARSNAEEVAHGAGVGKDTVRRWIKDETQRPTLSRLGQVEKYLARELGRPVDLSAERTARLKRLSARSTPNLTQAATDPVDQGRLPLAGYGAVSWPGQVGNPPWVAESFQPRHDAALQARDKETAPTRFPEVNAAEQVTTADPRARDFGASQLLERAREVAELSAWCEDPSTAGYRVVIGDPWAGKSAVMSEIAVRSLGCDVASFFVRAVGRRNTSDYFLDIINLQLRQLLGAAAIGVSPSRQRVQFEELWELAARRAEKRQRCLVLLLDGLDEQALDDDPPISALLPSGTRPWTKVLVATRPNPDRHPEMDYDHPYWDAARAPYKLSNSPHGRRIAAAAGAAVDRIMSGGDPDARRALGVIALADAPMTRRDLSEVVGIDRHRILRALSGLIRYLIGDGSEVNPWELCHEQLLAKTWECLHDDHLLSCQCMDLINAWAESYSKANWPHDTPAYLLHSYWGLLARRGDGRRLARLVSDEYQSCLESRRLPLSPALGAAESGLEIYAQGLDDVDDEDISAICRLALRHEELRHRIFATPPIVAGAWARLGDWNEVSRILDQAVSTTGVEAYLHEAVAQSRHPLPADLMELTKRLRGVAKVDVLAAMAQKRMRDQPDVARAMLVEAQQVADDLDDSRERARALARLALAWAAVDRRRAQGLLQLTETPLFSDKPIYLDDDFLALMVTAILDLEEQPGDCTEKLRRLLGTNRVVDGQTRSFFTVATSLWKTRPSQARLFATEAERILAPTPHTDLALELIKAERLTSEGRGALVDRVLSLAGRFPGHWRTEELLTLAATCLTGSGSLNDQQSVESVVSILHQIEDRETRSEAFGAVAVQMAAVAPTHLGLTAQAEALCDNIEIQYTRTKALAGVALELAAHDPSLARELIGRSERLPLGDGDPLNEPDELHAVAAASFASHPDISHRIAITATEVTQRSGLYFTILGAAVHLSKYDVDAALQFFDRAVAEAEAYAEPISEERGEVELETAAALAAIDGHDARLTSYLRRFRSYEFEGELFLDRTSMRIVQNLLEGHAPDANLRRKAERVARRIYVDEFRCAALLALANSYTAGGPKRLALLEEVSSFISHHSHDPKWTPVRNMVRLAALQLEEGNRAEGRRALEQAEQLARGDVQLLLAISEQAAKHDLSWAHRLLRVAEELASKESHLGGRYTGLADVAASPLTARAKAWKMFAALGLPPPYGPHKGLGSLLVSRGEPPAVNVAVERFAKRYELVVPVPEAG